MVQGRSTRAMAGNTGTDEPPGGSDQGTGPREDVGSDTKDGAQTDALWKTWFWWVMGLAVVTPFVSQVAPAVGGGLYCFDWALAIPLAYLTAPALDRYIERRGRRARRPHGPAHRGPAR